MAVNCSSIFIESYYLENYNNKDYGCYVFRFRTIVITMILCDVASCNNAPFHPESLEPYTVHQDKYGNTNPFPLQNGNFVFCDLSG